MMALDRTLDATSVVTTLDRSAEDSAAALGVLPALGLAADEVATRRERFGPNRLADAKPVPAWRQFVEQFRSILVGLLAVGALIAGLVGHWKDTLVISIVLLVNATLGFVQERRAEKSLAALRSMLAPSARVRRDGVVTVVGADELVPGDIVFLEAGDRVPADGRVLAAYSVEVDESALTGESLPVSKNTDPLPLGLAVGDQSNQLFSNTTLTRGRAELLVTATGMSTQIGRLADLLHHTTVTETPLQRQLHGLGQRLAMVAGIATTVYVVVGLIRGEAWGDLLVSAVALAVAAVPEGLPAVVTVTLAVGVAQLAKRGAIVRRLSSVETLGCTSVICSDKTGTLTMNEMTARAVVLPDGRTFPVTGHGYGFDGVVEADHVSLTGMQPLFEASVLCNDASVRDGALAGDPTEGALVVLAAKGGVDVDAVRAASPRVGEVPFDAAVKLMVTFHGQSDGSVAAVAKGAYESIAPRCALTPAERLVLDAAVQRLADDGMRVLAVASGRMATDAAYELTSVHDLELLGLVAIVDPPRPEARDAIATCRGAGIAVKMITGDHPGTAASIASQLGITGDVVTGRELDAMSDIELDERVGAIGVFARVTPEHKLRIVRALQHRGEVVAMTGDGVNDAPALKQADVGVAMGITGTEVTKEAAAMVLTDDNVATIVTAVERGRAIYTNIGTFVRFQLATNLGAIGLLVVAQLLGLPAPLAAIHVLWVNIIMDGPPALALGMDPPAPDTMRRPPRDPRAGILSGRRIAVLAMQGAVMAGGTIGVLAWMDGKDEARALTLAFTTFVLFQFFNALNARVERDTVFRRTTLRNSRLWGALGAVIALQIAVVHVGALNGTFKTTPLLASDWLVAVAVASSVLWIDEVRRFIVRRRAEAGFASVGTVLRFLWRSSQRVVVIVAGGALIVGGVAMLVLPGPGLLVIIAGLAVLAREFVWAERALASMKRRAASGASSARKLVRRRSAS